jgi:hypothetical protein
MKRPSKIGAAILGLAGIAASAFAFNDRCLSTPKAGATYVDVNGDGMKDIVAWKGKQEVTVLGQPNGKYLKTTVVERDGIPFYFTANGYYDPWGRFTSKDEMKKFEKALQVGMLEHQLQEFKQNFDGRFEKSYSRMSQN